MTSLQNDLQFMQYGREHPLVSQPAPPVQYLFFSIDGNIQEHDMTKGTGVISFDTPPASSSSYPSPPASAIESSFDNFVASPLSSTPTYPTDSPTRLRSRSRVPRPRNAFMIFRSEFWAGEKINRKVEHDHRHISRIIGHYWNSLSKEEKDIWHRKADQEQVEHRRKYPDYRYTPGPRVKLPVKRNVKRNGEDDLSRCRQVADLLLAGKEGEELTSAISNMGSISSTERKAECSRPPKKRKRKNPVVTPPSGSSSSDSPSVKILSPEAEIPAFRSPLLPPADKSDFALHSHNLPSEYLPPSCNQPAQHLPSYPATVECRQLPPFPMLEESSQDAFSFQQPLSERQTFNYSDYLQTQYTTPEPVIHSYGDVNSYSAVQAKASDVRFASSHAIMPPYLDMFPSGPIVYGTPDITMPYRSEHEPSWFYASPPSR